VTPLINVLHELSGLFFDDGWLAPAILGVVLLAAVAASAPGFPLAAGSVLLFGCLGVLFGNVVAKARR
jgi:uncharacterized membrane protein YdjX (TVP38/TMEM64 family)